MPDPSLSDIVVSAATTIQGLRQFGHVSAGMTSAIGELAAKAEADADLRSRCRLIVPAAGTLRRELLALARALERLERAAE